MKKTVKALLASIILIGCMVLNGSLPMVSNPPTTPQPPGNGMEEIVPYFDDTPDDT